MSTKVDAQSIIEELKQEQAARAEAQKKHTEAKRRDIVRRFQQKTYNDLGGPHILEPFDPEWSVTTGTGPTASVTLHYREKDRTFGPGRAHALSRATLAGWILSVDQEWAEWAERIVEAREQVVEILREIHIDAEQSIGDLRNKRLSAEQKINRFQLRDDPELAELMANAIKVIKGLEEQRDLERQREKNREASKALERTLAALAALESLDTYDELEDWERKFYPEYNPYRDVEFTAWIIHDEIGQAYTAKIQDLAAARDLVARRNELLTSMLFRPFHYYKVWYTLGIQDTEDYAWESEHIDTLDPEPSPTGWFTPQGADQPPSVWLPTHYKIERWDVDRPEQMPDWTPIIDTPFGPVKVPPGTSPAILEPNYIRPSIEAVIAETS